MVNSNSKTQIILNGELGAKYGSHHSLIAKTPAQAIRGLCANFPEFQDDVSPLYIEVKNGDRVLDPEFIHGPVSSTLEFTPAVSGSGGFGKLLLGGALIGLSFALPGAGTAAAAATKSSVLTLSKGFLTLGIGLALQGVYELITPAGNQEEKDESFFFNQIQSNSRQGSVFPCLVGEFYINLNDTIVLSSGIDSIDIPIEGGGKSGGK